MAISIITIDGESYDVGASAGNVAFNNSGTGISAGTVQGAIEEISATGGGGGGGYEPPVGGIPKSDLASDVQTSLDKADTALQSESDPVFAASAAHGITSTDINNWNNKANGSDIPTKVSDLTNDSAFITAQDAAGIVAGAADVVIVKSSEYIDIIFQFAEIAITPNTTMSLYAGQKTGTLTVSGTHLKQDITLAVPANFTAQVSGGTAAQSITIPHTNGTVSNTTVTITYTGADSGSVNDYITATSGTTETKVGLVYSRYQGATIIADSTLSINAAIGNPQIGELNVSGVNLEDDITASVGSGDFTICATQNGTYGLSATISKASAEASGGATLYVKYTPSSGTSTASGTLTLTTPRDGVNLSKTVTLTGAVATLTVSPSSLSLSSSVGVRTTDTFDVEGSALVDDVELSIEAGIVSEGVVNFQDFNPNHYIKTDGSLVSSNGWYVSDYVLLDDFIKTALFTKNNSVASVAFYDSAKTFIGYYQPSSAYEEITKAAMAAANKIPEGTIYVRLSNSGNSSIYNQYTALVSTDASSDFSVSPASISEVDGEASGTVTVGFTPSAAGSYTGKVTVSSGSVSKEVTITGTAS